MATNLITLSEYFDRTVRELAAVADTRPAIIKCFAKPRADLVEGFSILIADYANDCYNRQRATDSLASREESLLDVLDAQHKLLGTARAKAVAYRQSEADQIIGRIGPRPGDGGF